MDLGAFASVWLTVFTADHYQFGYKPGHFTGLCASAFKQTVDYYVVIAMRSHVCRFQ